MSMQSTSVKLSRVVAVIAVMAGATLSTQAGAANTCIAVNGGFGSGGTTFIGKGFSVPANGVCKSWAGYMRTATNVIGYSSGAGCTSSDGKILTLSLSTTSPNWYGTGVIGVDHIVVCPQGGTNCKGHYDYGSNDMGTALIRPCTSAQLNIPSIVPTP